jgi:hypothetical protein
MVVGIHFSNKEVKEMWRSYCKTCKKELYVSPGRVFSETTGMIHQEGGGVHNRHTGEIIPGGDISCEVILTETEEKE